MMYTDVEINDVVSQLVKSSIDRAIDPLGARKLTDTWNDMQESAAGVLLLHAQAPFYLAYLAAQRLRAKVLSTEKIILQILDYTSALRVHTTPVKDISALVNARAAIGELEGVVGKKTTKSLAGIPAFARFTTNIDRFLQAAGGNIKSAGSLTCAPLEAQRGLPGQVQQLQLAVRAIQAQVGYLQNAIANYNDLGLPKLLLSTVASRAREMLSSRIDQLQAMPIQERMRVLRSTVLELLGMKTVVTSFGSFLGINEGIDGTGTVAPYWNVDHPATAAGQVAKSGPYSLVAGVDVAHSSNILSAWLDGAAPPAVPSTQYFFPESSYAVIEGLNVEPYNIDGTNDHVCLEINGVPVDFYLPFDHTSTAASIAAYITAYLAIGSHNFKGEAYFFPLTFDGPVYSVGNTITMPHGVFPTGLLLVGYQVDFYAGPNAGITRTIQPGSTTTSIILDGPVLVTSTTDRIKCGPARCVRITPVDKILSLNNRETLRIYFPDTRAVNCGITLGIYSEITARSLPTDASTLAEFVSKNGNGIEGSVVDVAATAAKFRTEPSDNMVVVTYDWRGSASWGASTPIMGGHKVVAFLPASAYADIAFSHGIVLREGANPDAYGVLSVIHPGTDPLMVELMFTTSIGAGSGIVETGHRTFSYGQVVTITSGGNIGRYYVDVPHSTISFQATLRGIFPSYTNGFNEPILMDGTLGGEAVKFSSRNTTLSSQIELTDSLSTFFSTPNPIAYATTRYFQLFKVPESLDTDDFIDFYTTSLETPTYSLSILSLTSGIVELSSAISVRTTWTIGPLSSTPFVLIRSAKAVTFNTFAAELAAWLVGIPSTYFSDLARLVNPLLSNTNPSNSSIQAAEQQVLDFYETLTAAGALRTGVNIANSLEAILLSYTATKIPEVDVLLRTFQEKGADRATDLLLSCRFSSFFGVDIEDCSYAGAFQKAIRAVSQQDMPIEKSDREGVYRSRLISSVSTPDYEYDTSDTDTSPMPKLPGGIV